MSKGRLFDYIKNEVPDEVLEEAFCRYLDDTFGTFKIVDVEFRASEILKELDPVAYRCYKADFEDVYNNLT